jgi:hypothetical protein
VIGQTVLTCPDSLFKTLVGEGQIQRLWLELELQSAVGAVSSPTINYGWPMQLRSLLTWYAMARAEPAANKAFALDLRALCVVARNKTLLRVDAADESRRSTLLEAEQDEADELFAAEVLHSCSGMFIVYCGVPTDR